MSETQHQHHHHHHHHHKMDGASHFKRQSLLAIERRKTLAKWGMRILCGIAIFMAILVFLVYTIG
jgi:ABC-type nickel/cobalt efflux system permease component RcnA